ncbi:helix-turn-helix domain-containing protein [Terrimonas pollutisoli]|uniref:helix-turn-helix domain-containing protein n=1 Tax=Terrimonas pollutisoli TaxID=3034147 RepID=UPI0023EDEBFD|nr:AraC family transcriptional regulator [Terrimonas sp. H1YJ31]
MYNYYERVRSRPEIYNQLACRELLFVHYKCPMEVNRQDSWSQHNYIQYILTGKKAYHTPGRSWLMKSGDAFFVKKGAWIIEKFFEEPLCIMTFFIPDSYLQSFMRENNSLRQAGQAEPQKNELLIPLRVNSIMTAYFDSLIPYFYSETKPSEDLLELKFRELLLNILDNPENGELKNYMLHLLSPQHESFQQVMEANCVYNLSLPDYAKLLNLSLSSFKRHFIAVYKTTPGHWLQEQKLNHAYHLLVSSDKPVTDISFESGFENSTHFSHLFKKRFGLSPLKYRKENVVSRVS